MVAVAVLALVLVAHGWLPGLINDGPWNYLLEGDMRCVRDMGRGALSSWCDSFGLPQGYPFLTGGPFILFGAALMYLPGVGSYPAYLITGAAFDALALAGGFALMRVLGTGRAIALAVSALYLLSPTVIGLHSFGGTFTGFALLPAYAFVDLYAMSVFGRGRRAAMIAVACGYATVKTGAAFMDGYSFVVSALLSSVLWLWWAARGRLPVRTRLAGLTTMVLGHLIAFAAYSLYTPELDASAPLEFFRSMGMDVTTLVRPSDHVWAADVLGVARNPVELWGDGTNSHYNYLGFVCVALAVVAVATRAREGHVPALAVAGVLALALSLGPSLKVGDTRPPIAGVPSYSSYLMPAEEATAEFPWSPAFTRLPGLKEMRGVYRWSGLSRLVLLVLAGLLLDRLLRQRRTRLLGVVLGLLLVVELAPNLPQLVSQSRQNHQARTALTHAVVLDLKQATSTYERAFFLSPDGSYVDYLANFFAATARIKTYNAGGDKNSAFAATAWPPEVAHLARPEVGRAQVRAALASGAVEVVVAPYFHLRAATYFWPPSKGERDAAKRRFAPIIDDPRLDVRRYRWFATIRRR